MNNNITLIIITLFISYIVKAQETDTTKSDKFTFHGQTTVIWQYKPAFYAKYNGPNSLSNVQEDQTSITSTLFAGARLWEGGSVFVNPELGGGQGLSEALGVAASTNGETYRIGSPKPRITPARFYYQQIFNIGDRQQATGNRYKKSDQNQLGGQSPKDYFEIIIGKISVADFFDNNKYSHDPRTQFMSWALMSNGAWDYPANTIGYTPSIVLEWVKGSNELRYAISMVPVSANGMQMDWHLARANSSTLEYTKHFKLNNKKGAIRLLGYFTNARMGNYDESIRDAEPGDPPDIISTREYGHTKYGFGINAEQDITNNLGCFLRAGWNDGHNETWIFTEIDRTVSAGLVYNMSNYGRKNDNIGAAFVVSGLSAPHREYLEEGGLGFILGNGALSYSTENLVEIYYSAELVKDQIYLSGGYQFVLNPGYNTARGPVNVFSIRVHYQI